VCAAARVPLPLAEVAGRAQRLAAERWSGPAPDLTRLLADGLPEGDRLIEAFGIHAVAHFLVQGQVDIAQLLWTSRRLEFPLGKALDLCDDLVPLGVRVPGREAYPREPNNIEVAALKRTGAIGQPLTPLDIVRIAVDAGESVGAVHRTLAGLEQRGLLARPALTGPAEFVPTQREIDFADHGPTSPRLSARYSVSSPSAPSLLSPRLAAPWLRVAHIVALRRESENHLLRVASNLIPFTAPTAPLTYPELAELAYWLNTSLAGAADRLHTIYPEAQVPPLEIGCEGLTVSWTIHDALLRVGPVPSWRLNPLSVVKSALRAERPLGDFLGLLDPFRRLGAPVPPYDEEIGDALNKLVIDDYDLDLLTPESARNLGEGPRSITALALVAIAGRLGLTLTEVHQRLARLQPIGLVLEYPQVDLPDEIVYWHDLLALTTYFDGRPPAVSGRIDRAYLEQAAEEIFDATPDEIPAKADFLRQRLAVYAPLFELELPEEDAVA
jgi:hypothetical protein